MEENNSIQEKIISKLEEFRPFLNMEGGDVEFIKFDSNDGTLFVKMLGACSMCLNQDNTLEYGLLEAIQESIPEVKKIINVPI